MKPRLSTTALLAAACAVAAVAAASVEIRDVHGTRLAPFAPAGRASVLFFVSTECPISNAYAPEIQSLCGRLAPRGVSCSLIYEDLPADEAAVRRHLDEYGYRAAGLRAAVDSARTIATAARAAVTPEAVVVDPAGAIRYRGRIDNRYAAIGTLRPRVTAHDLSDALDAVLAGRPVATLETEVLGCAIVPADRLKK